MVVCQCNCVTDKMLRELGTTSYLEAQDKLGVGRGCGSCAPKVVDVLHGKK